MMKAASEVNGVWKWISGAMLVVFLAFLTPSIGWFVDSRNQVSQSEFTVVQDRQLAVLQRLSALETRLSIEEQILQQLRDELKDHANKVTGR